MVMVTLRQAPALGFHMDGANGKRIDSHLLPRLWIRWQHQQRLASGFAPVTVASNNSSAWFVRDSVLSLVPLLTLHARRACIHTLTRAHTHSFSPASSPEMRRRVAGLGYDAHTWLSMFAVRS